MVASLSVQEAAQYLDVTGARVYQMIREGKLRKVERLGLPIMVEKQQVEATKVRGKGDRSFSKV